MHLLHIIETLEFGGAEQVTVQLVNRLSRRHRITLCLVKGRGDLIARLNEDVELVCLDLGEGLHLDLPGRITALIRDRGIDLVHVHNWGLLIETWLGVRRSGRARMLLTVHGPYTAYGGDWKSRLKLALRHLGERMAGRGAVLGRIVTVSDAIQQYIVDDIGISRQKLQTIHNGVADTDFRAPTAAGPPRLITVGRLAPVKNQALMLDALALCRESGADLRLTVVGDGPSRGALEARAADLGIAAQVEFLGFRDDIGELLAAHDLFLLSSDYEGISIALLEAMRLARPAVATRVGGVPETIRDGETGLVVSPRDTDEFAAAILRLARDGDLRRRMGLAARALFEAEFHEDIMLDRYLRLYRELGPAGGDEP